MFTKRLLIIAWIAALAACAADPTAPRQDPPPANTCPLAMRVQAGPSEGSPEFKTAPCP